MFHHGFGRRTFRFETDTSGNAVVHHIDAKFAEEHYHYIGMFTIEDEIKEHFNLPASVEPSQNIALPENIFFIVVEGSTEVLGYAYGVGRQRWLTREINGNEIGTIFILMVMQLLLLLTGALFHLLRLTNLGMFSDCNMIFGTIAILCLMEMEVDLSSLNAPRNG